MKIAINFKNTYNNDRAVRMFTEAFWTELAMQQPNHVFLFMFADDKMPHPTAKNIQVQLLRQIRIKWLDKKRVHKTITRWQADCYIDTDATGFSVYHFCGTKNKMMRTMPPGIRVNFITTVQEQPKKEIPDTMKTVSVPPAFKTVVTSLSWTEAESIKTQYTGGRSFFLFTGNIGEQHQLVELLKAFSLFKKWQQSNMQLVIAGYTTFFTPVLEEKLLTYKYKADVVMLKNPPGAAIAKLLAASYAVLYPAIENIFPLALLRAVQSQKAIIASDTHYNRQITSQAEWVNEHQTEEGFAKAMILLYKDEKQQQSRVQQSIETAQQFNRRQMLTEVWQCIEK